MSIFKLNKDVPAGGEGLSRMDYTQLPPTRSVAGDNFSGGRMDFRFKMSGQKWWIPSKSYLRMRCELKKGDNTALDVDFGVAPNMGLMANMFQSCEMHINDKPVSKIGNYLAQIDALETRLNKSKSWLDSLGQTTNFWHPKQDVRLNSVARNGSRVSESPDDEVVTIDSDMTGYTAGTTVTLVHTTGVITFATAIPASSSVHWQVGDYFVPTAGTGVAATAGVLNVRSRVIAVAGNTITVEGIYPAAFGNADVRFSRIRKGETARNASYFETVWQPPLSLFNIDHALPAGDYNLILTPQSAESFQKRAIESLLGSATLSAKLPGGASLATEFTINVVDMYLYVAHVDGPRADDMSYILDLKQTRCQSSNVTSGDFTQKAFDVSPSTQKLTVAYQDVRAGTNTAISSSKFRSYEAGATPSSAQELLLNRFYINYAQQSLPAPDAQPSYIAQTGLTAGTDYTVQRYVDNQLYSGAWFDSGGTETLEEWRERGAYYHFAFPRDGTSRDTIVNVHQQFNGADVANMNILLFDHYNQAGRVVIEDGRVTEVDVVDL